MRQQSAFRWALNQLHAQVSNSSLLPHAHAGYVPLVADGLDFFLRRLSPRRLERIFAEQLQLPRSTPTEQRVAHLLQHSPVLHKLGQVVARDRRLSARFRQRLQRLESLPPSPSGSDVYSRLKQQLKPWSEERIELCPRPLAEGSVAVVIPFKWRSPGSSCRARTATNGAEEGVFKLLKGGVEDLLEQDLGILTAFGRFLDERCSDYHLPPVDYVDTFETIRTLLTHEVDIEREQQNLNAAARAFASHSSVIVPALLPFCTARLTAMERIHGRKIGSIRGGGMVRSEDVARGALVVAPFCSTAPLSLFHGDPHAGNLLVTPAGRLAMLDWSLAGRLTQADRASCLRVCLAALTLDLEHLEQSISGLFLSVRDSQVLRQVLSHGLQQVRCGSFPGVQWLTNLLDECVIRAGVRLPEDLVLFRKACWHLQGILMDLLPGSEHRVQSLVDEALSAGLLRQWLGEWPQRLASPFTAAELPGLLSNAELASFLFSLSLTPARCWLQYRREFLDRPHLVRSQLSGLQRHHLNAWR